MGKVREEEGKEGDVKGRREVKGNMKDLEIEIGKVR